MADGKQTEIPLRDRINLAALVLLWIGTLAWSWTGRSPVARPEVVAWIAIAASLACTVINMRGWLPLQNVVGSAVLTCGVSWALESALQWAGATVGHRLTPTHQRPVWYWLVPLLWMVGLINARGVVRLILRPARHWNGYGFWVIGLASILAALWMCVVDATITSTTALWTWQETFSIPGFNGLPALLPLRNLVLGLFTLTLGMPWLLNKKPVVEPINWHPLGMWVVGLSGMIALTVVRGNTVQAVAGTALLAVPAVLAVMGGMNPVTATATVRPLS